MNYDKEDIKRILIQRDGISGDEADEIIQACQDEILAVIDGEDGDPDDVVMDHLGLEPDYTMCFLD